jgi:hypothetical protein
MKDFRFFSGYGYTPLTTVEGETFATASLNDDTPEGHMGRRMLYHTDPMEYQRHFGARQEVIRRINGGLSQEEILRRRHESFQRGGILHNDTHGNTDYVPFKISGGPRVTKVNPKCRTKIKIFFQERFWFKDPSATIVIAFGLTIFVILSLAKILNVW